MNEPNRPKGANDMFCHAIYSTWHVVNRSYKQHLAPLDLTYPQYITLVLLWEKDGRIVTDIASALAMETSTLTPLLKRLEKRGYISRIRNKQDERQVVVSLTNAGKELKRKSASITSCMIDDTKLSEVELEGLIQVLRKLKAGLGRFTVK